MNKKFEFKPFDKVLVRDKGNHLWKIDLFSHITGYNETKYVTMYGFWAECIPYEPKDGDFVTFVAYVSHIKFTAICRLYKGYYMYYHAGTVGRERNEIHFDNAYCLDSRDVLRPATEEEKNELLSKLHENGKDWDAEKKEVVDWKWEPREGEDFYYPFFSCGEFFSSKATWFNDDIDCLNLRGKGYVFRTDEEAASLCDKLNKAIKEVK